jgi:hypothetical protein
MDASWFVEIAFLLNPFGSYYLVFIFFTQNRDEISPASYAKIRGLSVCIFL